MVSASDLRCESREFESRLARCRYLKTLAVPLSAQVNKLEPANCFEDNMTTCWEVTCVGLVESLRKPRRQRHVGRHQT